MPAGILLGAMSCGMTVEQYCTLSELKVAVATFHLSEFERLLPTGSKVFSTPDPQSVGAPLYAHADGAVFEMFAAFDTLSCALAHKLGFKRAERFSFKGMANDHRVPLDLLRRLSNTVGSDRWQRLEGLRHAAGHRSVVSPFLVSAKHLGGFKAYLSDDDDPNRRGDEALPVIRELLRWSEMRLRFLSNGICPQRSWKQVRMLQLAGGNMVRIEI